MESVILEIRRIGTFDSANSCSYTITPVASIDEAPAAVTSLKHLPPLGPTSPASVSSLTTRLTPSPPPVRDGRGTATPEFYLPEARPASSTRSSTGATSGSETLTNNSYHSPSSPTSTLHPPLRNDFTIISGMIVSLLDRIRKPSKKLLEAIIGVRCFLTMVEPAMVDVPENHEHAVLVVESLEKVLEQLIWYDSTGDNTAGVIGSVDLLWAWEGALLGVWRPVKNKSIEKKSKRRWARFCHGVEKAHWKIWQKLPVVKRKRGEWFLDDRSGDELVN